MPPINTLAVPEPWLPAGFWWGTLFGIGLTLFVGLLWLLWMLCRAAEQLDPEYQQQRAERIMPHARSLPRE